MAKQDPSSATTRPTVGNLYLPAPGEGPSAEHIQTLLKTGAIRLERLASHGEASPPGFWYDQPNQEWVILLQGTATLAFSEDWKMELKAGEYLLIPAHLKHRVERTSEDALWLAVHAA